MSGSFNRHNLKPRLVAASLREVVSHQSRSTASGWCGGIWGYATLAGLGRGALKQQE